MRRDGLTYDATRRPKPWTFRIDAPGKNGQRRQVRRSYATRDEAREARIALLKDLNEGRVPVPSEGTIDAFALGWLAALPAEGLDEETIDHYGTCLRRLTPHIGAIKIQALTTHDLDAAYAALLKRGLSNRSVRATHNAINKMLKEALRLRVISHNVASDARPPSPKSTKAKRFRTWTVPEILRFLDAIAEEHYAIFYEILAWTGLRRGELAALEWSDVDFDARTITVRQAAGKTLNGKVTVKATKTASGERVIELPARLLDRLKEHRKAQRQDRLARGVRPEHDYVCANAEGEILAPIHLTDDWIRLMKLHAPALGIKRIRLHDLRHSLCTNLLAAGVRADVVSKMLGHSSVGFTLSTYAHQRAGDQEAAIAGLLGEELA